MKRAFLLVVLLLLVIPAQAQEATFISMERMDFYSLADEFIQNANFESPENSEMDWDNIDLEERNWDIRFGASPILLSNGSELVVSVQVRQREPRAREFYICVVSVEQFTSECTFIPLEIDEPLVLLHSSDDGRYIVFTQDIVYSELDIIIFDLATKTIINRTAYNRDSSMEEPDVLINVLPTWSPNNDLYFFRSERTQTPNTYSTGLYRLTFDQLMEESDPELVYDLTAILENNLGTFNIRQLIGMLDGRSTISDDGSQLAVVLEILADPSMDVISGVWLFDLEGDSPPQRLLSDSDIIANNGLPDWAKEDIRIPEYRGLQWTNDGQGLIIATNQSNRLYEMLPTVYLHYYDFDSATLTPYFDYSDVSENVDEDIASEFIYVGDALPDGRIIYMSRAESSIKVWQIHAPDESPTLIYEQEVSPDDLDSVYRETRSSVGWSDGILRMYLAGHLLTFEWE